MNYGAFSYETVTKNKDCLLVNTLPNDTILLQYSEDQPVCELVNKLKTLNISFGDKPWKYIPSYLFGLNNYVEFESGDDKDFIHSSYDYSPVAYMFTHKGEYGYSQLTIYMSNVSPGGTVLVYEHQLEGTVCIRYYMEK